jgi:hypothetical protein
MLVNKNKLLLRWLELVGFRVLRLLSWLLYMSDFKHQYFCFLCVRVVLLDGLSAHRVGYVYVFGAAILAEIHAHRFERERSVEAEPLACVLRKRSVDDLGFSVAEETH